MIFDKNALENFDIKNINQIIFNKVKSMKNILIFYLLIHLSNYIFGNSQSFNRR